MGDLLTDAAAVNPEGIAATLGNDEISYRQLELQAASMAATLLRLARPGDRIMWQSEPDLRSLAGMAAVARAGMVFAPVNPGLSEAETGAAIGGIL